MTVQISTLAIRPDIDASSFSAGARDMANAQRQIVSGAREVSVAMTDASGKISTAGDPVARLSRQFVTGYGEMTRFTSGMRSLNNILETGRGAEHAAQIYQGMTQKLGLVANAADLTRQGYAELGAMVERVNAQMAHTSSVGGIGGRLPVNDNMSTFRRQNLMYQAFDIGQTIGPLGVGRTLVQQGPQIIQMYAGQGGINALLKDAGSLAGGFAARLAPIAPLAIAGGAAIHQMQEDIEKATGKSVTFGETFSAAVHVVADDIKTALSPALETVSPMVAAAWDKITAGAILTGDTIINSFHAAYSDIKFIWSQFPNMIGGLIDGGMNLVIGGVETTLNTVSGYFDAFIRKINSMLDRMSELSGGRFKGHINEIGTFDLPRVDNTFARDFSAANDRHKEEVQRILSSSPLEDYYKSVRDRISGDMSYGLPTGGPGSPIPIPKFRGIDDNPADQDFMTDFKRRSELRVEQMKQEITAIGMSGKALSAYRFEMEALNAAMAKNIDLSPEQREAIRRQAEAYAVEAEAANRARMGNELSFERGQFFRSPLDQQIASRQRSAGLPIDMGSPEAMQMRQLDRMERIYERGMSFWDDFERGVRSGDDIGKAFVKAFRNAMMEELADVAKTAFSNFMKAGIAAVFPSAGAPAVSGAGIAGSLLGGANDNYAPGAVTRAPLPDVGSFASAGVTKTGIPLSSISVQGLGAKVNAAYADRFQGLLNDLTAAGYPITSLGEGGYSFRNVAGSKNLSNHAFGNAIDINPRQNPWAVGAKGNFAQYGIDPNELAQKNGLFWGGNWNKSDAMHFQVDKTVKSLDKLSTSSIDTAKSLEGGLGKLGNSLNQFPAAPSGGGAGGLLGSLFGGLNSAFSGSKAFNFLSANTGKFINFYADGTEGAPPGWAWVGERGPELMRMRGGETIRSNQRSMQMTTERANGGGVAAIVPDIRVYVDQDGNWQAKVEKISQGPARQESNRAVGNYAYQQSNGGAKADDHRYQRLKRRA